VEKEILAKSGSPRIQILFVDSAISVPGDEGILYLVDIFSLVHQAAMYSLIKAGLDCRLLFMLFAWILTSFVALLPSMKPRK
jgi:hypothetical protein